MKHAPLASSEEGVPLVQLAAVHAAVALGFQRSEALECEGLDEEHWRKADAAWRVRLAGSITDFRAYQDALAERQDALARSVTPLDDDLHAWTTFLKVYGASPAPAALLDEIGIKSADLARLERRWRARLEEDTALAREGAEIERGLQARIDEGEVLALPAITIGPKRLVPSPAARARASARHDAPGSAGDIEEYAKLGAKLRIAGPRGRRAALAGHQLDDAGFAALEAEWQVRLEADPSLKGVLAARMAHHERIATMRRSGAMPAPKAPPRAPSGATLDLPDFIAAPPPLMPFEVVPAVRIESSPPRHTEATADMPDYIEEPALPFVPPQPRGEGGTIQLPDYIPFEAPPVDDLLGHGETLDPDLSLQDLPVLPWARPDPVAAPRSFDTYTPAHLASLHAELDLGEQDAAVIRSRYDLASEDEQSALEKHFEARFKRQPSEFAEYRKLRIRFRRPKGP